MKRLLTITTIGSLVVMPLHPTVLWAQVLDKDGRILAADGTVLCEPTVEKICDILDEDIIKAAQVLQERLDAEAAAQAAVDAAAQAEANAAAVAQAAAQMEADAQAAADVAAQAAADGAAQAEAAARAEADAAAQAAVQAQADAQAASDAAAKADADAAAQAAADAAAQAETAAKADADAQAKAAAAAEAAAQAAADQAAADAAAIAETTALDGTPIDPAAGLVAKDMVIDPNAPLVDAPNVSQSEAEALTTLLSAPADPSIDAPAPAASAPITAPPVPTADPASSIPPDAAQAALKAIPAAPNAVATNVVVITPEATRSSAQEFSAPPQTVAKGKRTDLSDLEKVGLFVLGALVIGQVLDNAKGQNNGSQKVVSNTGDRVVVQNPDGTYGLYKDDDAILRQPGSTVRTETYTDGSSRTIVQRTDGTQVVTVRDATGRVLRRAQYDRLGRELVLLDDFTPERPVIVADLPRPRIQPSAEANDAALRAALAARQIEKLGRSFSLRQIREIPQVRALAAEVAVEKVTFASGSAAITPAQANALADLGGVMQDMLAKNPAEIFLVEGHTDAVGAAAMNLALSDRRAESVALALAEYFDIPPENMVIQGYGETELRIDTQASEAKNRRVAVRVITPLLHGSLK